LWNLSDTTEIIQILDWTKEMRSVAKSFDGNLLTFQAAAIAGSDLAADAGISAFDGVDSVLTSDGTETYLALDRTPNKFDKGAGDPIDTWTLGNVSNATGNWNAVCSTTYPDGVGIGSIIKIDSGKGVQTRVITALTSNGEAANEVTLDFAAPSGKITFLGGQYTFVQMPSGLVVPKGVYIQETAAINVNAEMVAFEAVMD
jgi:hypothetical protein